MLTQTMSTMLNDAIIKYKELYSQLITAFAGLHNANLLFVKTRGREPGFLSRKHLRDVENLAKDLKRQSQLVCKENLANVRLAEKLKKEEIRNGKRNKKSKRSL